MLFALLAALGACIGADVACRALLPPSGAMVRYESAREYFDRAPTPDIQILGDSVAQQGLLASALGTNSVYVRNDALPGSYLPHSYYIVRRELAAGRAPHAIVIAHTPFGLGHASVDDAAAAFLDWRELFEMSLTAEWTHALYGATARASYILQNRQSFRLLLMGGEYQFFIAPSANHLHRPPPERAVLEAELTDRTLDIATGIVQPSDLTAVRGLTFFRVSKGSDSYLRKLLALAKSHDVRVFWLMMPVAESVADLLHATRYEDRLRAYLGQFEKTGELTVLDPRIAGYDDAWFSDIVHMRGPAAIQFSCDARVLATRLAATVRPHGSKLTDRRAKALLEQAQNRRLLAEVCADQTFSSLGSG